MAMETIIAKITHATIKKTNGCIETIIGFAISLSATAIALARAKWPMPTPLLVARIMVGFVMFRSLPNWDGYFP
jgi:uncharacterized membrane protein YoaK (UPF0700 family)